MSGRSSPVNGGYESARLTVRKDLFPDIRITKQGAAAKDSPDTAETDESISCVKLETDFEQSIDEIANKKIQANGALLPPTRSKRKKHKQHSRRDTEHNGYLPTERKRKKHRHRTRSMNNTVQVISGKNLSLVSSSKYRGYDEEMQEAEEAQPLEEGDGAEEAPQQDESSEDEVLKCSVKLPSRSLQRQSGKPYSHELSQLSTRKSKKESKMRKSHAIIPCSGKPRSMLNICSHSKKKSKKNENTTTYQSQIVDTNTIKIKIRRTSLHEATIIPAPVPVPEVTPRKSKKKRSSSPVPSESSGEEYDPSCSDKTTITVATRKPRQSHTKTPKTRKSNTNKKKNEKTERNRISAVGQDAKDTGPQSPWGHSMPPEVLLKIFDYVICSKGTLPSVIRLGRVCKLWHSISCTPDLWKSVDLAQYTIEKCKTDYKLVWLLENRLSQCQSLNIAQWKVCNITWVLTSVAECCPNLTELSIAGWGRITAEQLYEVIRTLPNLQKLDLSLTSEIGGSGSCLSAASMARICENFGERLTHLTLANNKFTALTQILSSIAGHCKNLEVLDISGAQATTHPAAVPLEALQKGCPKMRIFRAANAQLVLASATTLQQMETEGWTQLEELSVAGEEAVSVGEYRLGDDALCRLVRGATRLRLLDLRGLQRLSDSGLVRVPAWDLQHLFLGGCNVTRQSNACLELICEKWSHSLLELDLSWASATRVLDDAVCALADSTSSKLRILNLCGSSVSLEPVKKVLLKCPHLESLNLSSCRALPRGMKRLFAGKELQDLKDSFDPVKIKAKEEKDEENVKTKKGIKKSRADSKSDADIKDEVDLTPASDTKVDTKSSDNSSTFHFQEPKSISDLGLNDKLQSSLDLITKSPIDEKSVNNKSSDLYPIKDNIDIGSSVLDEKKINRDVTPKLLSPMPQSRPDSSSTPRSEPKSDFGSPHFSPVAKPDSQVQSSPDIQVESIKSSSWHLGTFKSTPTYNKSEASPLNRIDSSSKIKHNKIIEQCSPTTSLENKRSPEMQGVKQDIKNPNTWNYGNYSPMPRQDNQFSSQRSPYSAQPSPAQPSPYSTQPSPYSTQPSPYSSQPSPYSAQPSPDTSQIVKPDLPKSGAWNTGNYSPMPKHHAPYSPHPSTHPSPDPGLGMKPDIRNNPNRTPGQYSPMSRQDRMHHSPYSPRPSIDSVVYSNKKSPGVGNYSPMMRPDYHLPSPDRGPNSRTSMTARNAELYARNVSKVPDLLHNIPLPENTWSLDKFNQASLTPTSTIESLVWGAGSLSAESLGSHAAPPAAPSLTTPPPQAWTELPSFETSVRRLNDISDPWSVGQFRVEPPHTVHNNFVEQNVNFESLNSHHIGHQTHTLPTFLDDGFTETSRVD